MTETPFVRERAHIPRLVRVVALALALNIVAWLLAAWKPDAQGSWGMVSLFGCFLLGLTIGRWWALHVIVAYGVIHAIPVSLGWLPGFLSSWGEALWWLFALTLMLGIAALGVLARGALRRLQRRFGSSAA